MITVIIYIVAFLLIIWSLAGLAHYCRTLDDPEHYSGIKTYLFGGPLTWAAALIIGPLAVILFILEKLTRK